MRDVVVALAAELATLGIDVGDRAASTVADMESLDAEVREILAGIAPEQRKLVTGHESMGYFADRYGFELVGTVVPGLTTDGEPSARELSELISEVREAGVSVVFSEVGTPRAVARAVADDSGARLVELSTSQLPEGGGYDDLIRAIAGDIAAALTE